MKWENVFGFLVLLSIASSFLIGRYTADTPHQDAVSSPSVRQGTAPMATPSSTPSPERFHRGQVITVLGLVPGGYRSVDVACAMEKGATITVLEDEADPDAFMMVNYAPRSSVASSLVCPSGAIAIKPSMFRSYHHLLEEQQAGLREVFR